MILWVNSDLVSDGGRCHVSCYESVGASRHHIEPSCRVSDDALRRRPDVGCRTKFVAHPGGILLSTLIFLESQILQDITACFHKSILTFIKSVMSSHSTFTSYMNLNFLQFFWKIDFYYFLKVPRHG